MRRRAINRRRSISRGRQPAGALTKSAQYAAEEGDFTEHAFIGWHRASRQSTGFPAVILLRQYGVTRRPVQDLLFKDIIPTA